MGLPNFAMHQGKRVRVLHRHSRTHIAILHPQHGQHLVSEESLTFLPDKKPAPVKKPVQMTINFGKGLSESDFARISQYTNFMAQSRFGGPSVVGRNSELVSKRDEQEKRILRDGRRIAMLSMIPFAGKPIATGRTAMQAPDGLRVRAGASQHIGSAVGGGAAGVATLPVLQRLLGQTPSNKKLVAALAGSIGVSTAGSMAGGMVGQTLHRKKHMAAYKKKYNEVGKAVSGIPVRGSLKLANSALKANEKDFDAAARAAMRRRAAEATSPSRGKELAVRHDKWARAEAPASTGREPAPRSGRNPSKELVLRPKGTLVSLRRETASVPKGKPARLKRPVQGSMGSRRPAGKPTEARGFNPARNTPRPAPAKSEQPELRIPRRRGPNGITTRLPNQVKGDQTSWAMPAFGAGVAGAYMGTKVGKSDEDIYTPRKAPSTNTVAAGLGAVGAGMGIKMIGDARRLPTSAPANAQAHETIRRNQGKIMARRTNELRAKEAKLATVKPQRKLKRYNAQREVDQAKYSYEQQQNRLATAKINERSARNTLKHVPLRQKALRHTGLGLIAGGSALAAGALTNEARKKGQDYS